MRHQHQHDLPSFLPGMLLNNPVVAQISFDPLQHLQTTFLMSHLAPSEPDRYFRLVTLTQKFDQAPQLGLVITFIGAWPEFDFLDLNLLLLLSTLLRLLVLIKPEFAVIHDAAYRWVRIRHQYDQIKVAFIRYFSGILKGNDSMVLPVYVYQTNGIIRNVGVETISFCCADKYLLKLTD